MEVEKPTDKGDTPMTEQKKETPQEKPAKSDELDVEMRLLNEEIEKLSTEEIVARTKNLMFEARTHQDNARVIKSRLSEKNATIRENNDKIQRGKQLPYLVGHIVEVSLCVL